ncbi:hypothetical protein [Bradyrhizobium sp. WSM1253]|uniref:hypothetical protein n=1 Tax=Bradyrhizobium sp. WSM1253 TaxID=319003 RepID=UPI00025D20A0|nr:hypothetical protein [Bradyrhizobium sp. WSM1253]EIG58457.1 hypothetical protein Bra1253DRAFT_03162 [Bradyrhizobium sp. WSM1253]
MGLIVRSALLTFGVLSLVWAYLALPSFVLLGPARTATDRISVGERFKPELVRETLAQAMIDPATLLLHPEIARVRALLATRLADEALQNRSGDVDTESERARENLLASLERSPSEALLWLSLYSVSMRWSGFDSKYFGYLNQSYLVGPREGWIANQRSRIALGVFPMLPSGLQRNVLDEFAALVDSGFVEDASLSILGVGWTYRDRLLENLQRADIVNREQLARRLSWEGVSVAIPGVAPGERPWR